ncbi:hypothetical protein B0I33_113202 [Prauserella shujinwangii]|uniref:Uncharacterized protein n=1 Tax=Prauserella shujinwangii TaxID=1453103 RepID=A0A2T0LLW4_9PSEU|nr:hypothetical protein [Prauserella shujinwangii]PRX44036.1 hypothetical protein B0I33_113202 [Prauserella shujinwangii]
MSGRGDQTERFSATPARQQPRHGRHRRAQAAGTWTPAVPAQQRLHRHTHDAGLPTDPLASSISGSLPVSQPDPAAGATHGELPLPPSGMPDQPTQPTEPVAPACPEPAGSAGPGPGSEPPAAPAALTALSEQPTVRRTKVSLTAPPPEARVESDDDEARVYVAPPADGLGNFDLGSVPASVTPPRTWRKAAWFASLASGGVVVSMLVAGSMLVSQPHNEGRAIEGWTDRHGGAPLLPGEYYVEGTADPTSGPATTTATTSASASTESDEAGATDGWSSGPPQGGVAPAPGRSTPQGTSTTRPTPPPTTAVPRKPPVTPAPTTTANKRYLFPRHNAEKMGARSQDFLNTVTEDPAAAHELTTGELAEQGPDGLRRRYAAIAYFVVKQVYVDQHEGFTVNTVEVTWKDGRKTEETRKLYFGDGDKIESDGR